MAGRDRRRFLALRGARTAAFRFVFPAAVLALLFPAIAGAYREFRDNTAHDFVRYGFLGGGVCDECHAAGGIAGDTKRLFRWDFSGSDIDMCADKCHSVTPSWPTEDVWVRVASSYGGNPPQMSHLKPVSPYRCEYCHRDMPLTGGAAYADCLHCHTSAVGGAPFNSTGAGYDIGTDIEVDTFMDGIGVDINDYDTLSQHDIRYDASGNLAQAADNECLKCHGTEAATEHPGGTDLTPLLVYPDDPDGTGALLPGSGIAATDDYAQYQLFCLSCHDGEADGVSDDAVRFNGTSVPPVPPYEYRLDDPFNSPYLSTTPYFAYTDDEDTFPTQNYFMINGHGRKDPNLNIEGGSTNMTCLAQNPGAMGPQAGCHSAHGSNNLYLIEDSGNLGTGVDTAAESGLACMACHDRVTMSEGYINNLFHYDWAGRLTHVGVDPDAYVCWEPLPPGSFPTGVQAMPPGEKILPFFSSSSAHLRTGRQYSDRVFGSAVGACDGSVFTCVTCHDPHGTAEAYDVYNQSCFTPTLPVCEDHTRGMLRVFSRTFGYNDPLCKNCHKP